ncbi:PREDICTED: probable imidazolonepropionase isoform X2 [Thamnophis sirtalis]|nr:PREDICTED: probable imidazolonepropionase isoform X2 [Thamnophis sirtalis]
MAGGEYKLLLEGAEQLVLVCTQGEQYLLEAGMEQLALRGNASVVIGKNGCIEAVGDARAIREQFSGATFDKIIDCSGKCILPGWYGFKDLLYQAVIYVFIEGQDMPLFLLLYFPLK